MLLIDLETIIDDDVKKAYLVWKREVYYDHINLFLREEITKFEKDLIKDNKYQEIVGFISAKDITSEWFTSLLSRISVNFLPKKIKSHNCDGNGFNFISNLRSEDEYDVTEVNYFFSGDVSLYILSSLWCMTVGPLLEKEFPDECLGNRLDLNKEKTGIASKERLFKLYINQYNQWRDKAIQTGLDTLEQNQDVLLVALDFKQCFYHLQIDWNKIKEIIKSNTEVIEAKKKYLIFLTDVIEKIHHHYFINTKEYLSSTHVIENYYSEPEEGIPIGLPSSQVLANWELRKFDQKIMNELHPIYYGRYVDDVLIVLNNPDKNLFKEKTDGIIKKYFVDTQILEELNVENKKEDIEYKPSNKCENNEKIYKVKVFDDTSKTKLLIQNGKVIIHYYEHNHSWAGLKEFKEELQLNASEFRFLPEEDQYKDLVNEAYDIHYNGSMYKFRSVIGINENATKLSHFLYKQQLKFWLCNSKMKDKTIEELFRFYKGKNIFDYCRLWERVFTLFIVSQRYRDFTNFYNELEKTINKLNFKKDEQVTRKLIKDCVNYRYMAMCMSLGYMGECTLSEKFPVSFVNLLKKLFDKFERNNGNQINLGKESLPRKFRRCLLLRHQNMCWPLLDYSIYKGDLCKFDWKEIIDLGSELNLDDRKLNERSRFLHLDEFLLFESLRKILHLSDPKFPNQMIDEDKYFIHFHELWKDNCVEDISEKSIDPISDEQKIFEFFNTDMIHKNSIEDKTNFSKIEKDFYKYISAKFNESNKTLFFKFKKNNEQKDKFRIGIVNIKVDEKDIEAAYNPRKQPNLTYERQMVLFSLINQAIKKPACDLIVFPEVSIPFAWLPFMVTQARRKDVGLVFGLEHVIQKQYALNLVATVLPFTNENNYHSVFLSLRLKNHYSPGEKHELSLFNLERPGYKYLYEMFSWRGAVFSIYNCYELTDIKHRGLFRSFIDLMIAVEYNPDINYFSNIIESTSRDIHCYAVQANSSDYGDSRIVSPVETERMNVIRVKGGENAVLLKTTLDIEGLRDFQSREYSPNYKEFKPTPAGYNHIIARNRK